MSKWQSMETMPSNKLVLFGVWVQHNQEPKPHPEYYIAMYDAETHAAAVGSDRTNET